MTRHRFFTLAPRLLFASLVGIGCTDTVTTTTTTRTTTWTTRQPPTSTIDKPHVHVPSAESEDAGGQCPPNVDCGTWVDLGDSDESCGERGTRCKADEICSDGQCKRSCSGSKNGGHDAGGDAPESCEEAD